MDSPPPRRSLKDKFKEHWDTRDQIFNIPPKRANAFGVAFFWIFTISLMYTSLQIMVPQLARYETRKQFWMKISVWLIFVESVANWYLSSRRCVSCVSAKSVPQGDGNLVTSLPEGWRCCPTCQLDVPPRSHHCKVCSMCVLKRDHHCFFTGACVGYFNQRYFVVLCFWISIGNIYSLILILKYLSDPLPFLSHHIFNYFPPVAVVHWGFGGLHTSHFLLLLQFGAACLMLFASAWFFMWEMCMIYRGQTSFEATRGNNRYRVDVSTHFQSVFGPFWIFNFIVPLPTKQIGNGVDWTNKSRIKGH